jgi:hypothetical protein
MWSKIKIRRVGPPVPQMSTGGFAIFGRIPAAYAGVGALILISETSLGILYLLR